MAVYTVESASHRGVTVVGTYDTKHEAVMVMRVQSRTSVVRNESGRIIASNVARSF